MSLSKELLGILVCPGCKGELDYQEQDQHLVCSDCGLAYPIENDIPIMLVDRAHILSESNSSLLDKVK
ncbi:MAG: Trm112 family protein [Fidelibacterota bacterium]|nr:MAG: Trm112 family protein [Candidatus Neomarinimicrobiota bacterium]